MGKRRARAVGAYAFYWQVQPAGFRQFAMRLDIDGRPPVVKRSIDDGEKVKIAAIERDSYMLRTSRQNRISSSTSP
jgi:hypothetical protein